VPGTNCCTNTPLMKANNGVRSLPVIESLALPPITFVMVFCTLSFSPTSPSFGAANADGDEQVALVIGIIGRIDASPAVHNIRAQSAFEGVIAASPMSVSLPSPPTSRLLPPVRIGRPVTRSNWRAPVSGSTACACVVAGENVVTLAADDIFHVRLQRYRTHRRLSVHRLPRHRCWR